MGTKRYFGMILAAIGVAACSSDFPLTPAASSVAGSSNVSITPQYLVLGKMNKLPHNLAAEVAAAGGTVVSVIPHIGIAVIEGGEGFAEAAGKFSWVETVAPDLDVQWIEQPTVIEEDLEAEGVASDAHTFNPNAEGFYGFQWAPQSIDAPTAWANGITGQGARVAVLDGGIHGAHVDLRDRIDVARWHSSVRRGIPTLARSGTARTLLASSQRPPMAWGQSASRRKRRLSG